MLAIRREWLRCQLDPIANDPKQKFAEPLLDNLVGDGEQCRRHVEAERLGGLEVDH
jgi:hypothetical protein